MSWTAGGGAGSPERGPAAVSSPGKTKPALPGSARGFLWPWSSAVACVTHWRPQGGGSGLGTGPSTARAARRPRSSPERGAWAPRARQGLRGLAQKGIKGSVRHSPCSSLEGDAAQKGRRRARRRWRGWRSRRGRHSDASGSGSPRINAGLRCEQEPGVRTGQGPPAARNRAGGASHRRRGLGENSARWWWRLGQQPRGKLLSARRSSWGARRGRGGGEAASPRRRWSRAEAGERLGSRAAAEGWIGFPGGCGLGV